MEQAGKFPSEGISASPASSEAVCPTFVLGRGAATAFSPAPQFQGGGWKGGRGGHGNDPGTAGLGAEEAGADGARPVQLRPEAAGNSAQRWVPLSRLGPAGLV